MSFEFDLKAIMTDKTMPTESELNYLRRKYGRKQMNNVYVLISREDYEQEILGVFATKEAAFEQVGDSEEIEKGMYVVAKFPVFK